jgi:hypothetical protein
MCLSLCGWGKGLTLSPRCTKRLVVPGGGVLRKPFVSHKRWNCPVSAVAEEGNASLRLLGCRRWSRGCPFCCRGLIGGPVLVTNSTTVRRSTAHTPQVDHQTSQHDASSLMEYSSCLTPYKVDQVPCQYLSTSIPQLATRFYGPISHIPGKDHRRKSDIILRTVLTTLQD